MHIFAISTCFIQVGVRWLTYVFVHGAVCVERRLYFFAALLNGGFHHLRHNAAVGAVHGSFQGERALMVVAAKGSRSLDLLFQSSTHGLQLRHIPNMYEFEKWQAVVPLLYNIPPHLLEHIPAGPEADFHVVEQNQS